MTKNLCPEYIKVSTKTVIKKTNNAIKKVGKDLKKAFHKSSYTQGSQAHDVKIHLTSLAIRETHTETTRSYFVSHVQG